MPADPLRDNSETEPTDIIPEPTGTHSSISPAPVLRWHRRVPVQLNAELGQSSFTTSDLPPAAEPLADQERRILHGMIEKKSYINLVCRSLDLSQAAEADPVTTVGPGILGRNEAQPARRERTILLRPLQLGCVPTQVYCDPWNKSTANMAYRYNPSAFPPITFLACGRIAPLAHIAPTPSLYPSLSQLFTPEKHLLILGRHRTRS